MNGCEVRKLKFNFDKDAVWRATEVFRKYRSYTSTELEQMVDQWIKARHLYPWSMKQIRKMHHHLIRIGVKQVRKVRNLEILAVCPECGSTSIWADYSCHTYWAGGQWMACLPCDSAADYWCDDCSWRYEHGLNPKNPRHEENEKHRPAWLDYDFSGGFHPGVKTL